MRSSRDEKTGLRRRPGRETLAGVLAAAVPFALYLRTLAPTVYGLDSAELTTGAYALGIVHAPGCPTYLLLGRVFAWLPFGDVGYRLNLLSAVAGALTALLLQRIVRRLTGSWMIGLGTAWFAAVTYYFWVSAVAAELYAVHATFVAAVLLLALRWRSEGRPSDLCLLSFLFGLGTGNHMSMVLLLPGFAWLVLTGAARPWSRRWLLPAVVACGLSGASIYLYIPLRYLSDTPLNYARDYWGMDLASLAGMRWMLTARMFEPFFFAVPFDGTPHELWVYTTRLWSNFAGLGAVLGFVGVFAGLRRDAALHAGLLLLFSSHLIFYLGYGVADKELMFLPTHLLWAVWVGVGTNAVARTLGRSVGASGIVACQALLFFLAFGTALLNFGRVDLSDDWSARRLGERVLAHLERGAVYMGTWGDVPILEYLQIVEARRPDVKTVNLLFTPGRAAQIAEDGLRAGRPVYTSAPRFLGDSRLRAEHEPGCGCYRVLVDRTPG